MDYWTADLAVIVDGVNIDDQFFSGEFDNVREMLELTQDEYVELFGDAVYFSVSLNPLNV